MDSYDEVKQEALEENNLSSTKILEESKGPCKPMELVFVPEIKKIPAWLRSTLEEENGNATPDIASKEVKKPNFFSRYAALMTNLIDAKPCTYHEETR